MKKEIVIRVPPHELPRSIVESDEYKELSVDARDAFLGHIRYVQELPFKLDEWLSGGGSASELESLVNRVDLDVMINLAAPRTPKDGVSPWLLRTSWAWSDKPLFSYLETEDLAELNRSVPVAGAPLSAIRVWVRDVAQALTRLMDRFFLAESFDRAVAYLVAVHVYLSGLRFGLGRIALHFPRS